MGVNVFNLFQIWTFQVLFSLTYKCLATHRTSGDFSQPNRAHDFGHFALPREFFSLSTYSFQHRRVNTEFDS